jgi:hypothetical protein
MPDVEFFEGKTRNHWSEHSLRFYKYTNLLEEKDYKNIKKVVTNLYNKAGETKFNYMIHGLSFNVNGEKVKVVSSKDSSRYQEIPFDWSYHKDWLNNNKSTIKTFTDNLLYSGEVNPVFIKFVKLCETLPPFNQDPKWICYRMHLNMLNHTTYLGVHRDGSSALYNKPVDKIRYYSMTYYLWDHVEGEGGELFTIDGHVYKPVQNTAVCFNGHQVIHGVTTNMSSNKKPRLGFTTRWIYADDIGFPNDSNIDNLVYEATYS